MDSSDIRAVLCDLDGVVRHWAPPEATGFGRDFGLPAGTFAATAFAPELVGPAITGTVTDAQWRASGAGAAAVRAAAARRAGPPPRRAVSVGGRV